MSTVQLPKAAPHLEPYRPTGRTGEATSQTAELVAPSARRIALVEFAPSGGLFHFGLQLGEGLARQGHAVEVLTGPDPEARSREPGCVVRPLLPTWHPAAGRDVHDWVRRARRVARAGRLAAAWLVLAAHAMRTRPDVLIWSEWRFALDGLAVAGLRKLLPGTVFGLIAHEPVPLVEQPGQDALYKVDPLTRRTHGRAYDAMDVLFVLGETAKAAVEREWQPAAPVVVIPHGDEGIFGAETVLPAQETGPVVLFFGTVTAYKGLDLLLEAWPHVRQACPEARLVVAGKVNADVDEAALRRQAAGCAGVELRLGYVDMAAVPGLFEEARVVALPYVRSSQSGVANLAHTFARPVVSTRVGDIPEVVKDGVNGLLCEPGDPDALTDALVGLLQEPQLAGRMGAAGRRRLDEEASWDEVARLVTEALPGGPIRSLRR